PRLREQLKQYVNQQNAGGRPLTQEEIERFKNLLDQFAKANKGGDPGIDMSKLIPPKGHRPHDHQPKKGPPPPDRPPPWSDDEAQAAARKQLEDWSRAFENWANKLEDAPALQDAVRDLGKAFMEMRSSDLPPEDRLDTQLADLNRYSQD